MAAKAYKVNDVDFIFVEDGSGVRLDQILQGLKEVDVTLSSADSTTPVTAGADLTLESAKGNGAASGAMSVLAADGDFHQDGGAVFIGSGAGGQRAPGGQISVIANDGGAAIGDGSGGDGGVLDLASGNGADGDIGGDGGRLRINSQQGGIGVVGASGKGGAVSIGAGDGGAKTTGTTAGDGGSISINAGNSGGIGGDDGLVNIATSKGDAVIGRSGARVQYYTFTPVKTAAYVAKPGEIVQVDPTGGTFPVTLPTALGRQCTIIVVNSSASANPVTVTAMGGETINGAPTFVMSIGHESITFVNDGISNWVII